MAFVWCLASCQKDDSAAPRIDAPFGQQVALRQQQSGAFPNQRVPELTIGVDAVNDSRCPQDVVCVWGGIAEAVLSVQASDGSSQSLKLVLSNVSADAQGVVQANGRTYLVVLHDVTPYPSRATAQQPKSVVISVQRN
ncbi:hypothetical protein SAMN04515668_2121 [Hymenobacter arizonensis]|uniref:Uncharacterized protein n=2 Tax=Hymenobacter arizonensis TaxID=1227077 RepID=A0A1I5XYM7_HYMAR|nr:hypothetical protein SAMN04515668_2121 [Hymenobacter arizonensis]